MCGGTSKEFQTAALKEGLSPRVRGNPRLTNIEQTLEGSIPACAGEPLSCSHRATIQRVYPRVCGGTPAAVVVGALEEGLSPRVRGNLNCVAIPELKPGSIPACAGEPNRCNRKRLGNRVYPRVCGGTSLRVVCI